VTAVLLASGARVHAFEPDPHAGKILSEKFGHLPNFTLHAVAVGTAAGKAIFFRSESNDLPDKSGLGHTLFDKSRFVQNNKKRSQIEVDVIDFPAFLTGILDSGHALPFVKLDVEGAELGIVRRMLDLSLFDQIRLTLAETHERIIPDWADDYARLRRDVAARYPKSRVNLDWI
jgi:FkbM family methyltransferase